MSTAAEVAALANDPDVKPLLQTNWMKAPLRAERQREIDETERVLRDPALAKQLSNPGKLAQQTAQRKQTLEAQTPPPLKPAVLDKVARLNRVALNYACDGMLSLEELRRRPPGAADRLRAWERAKKSAVLAWKRTQALLHPDSEDRDLANLERYRPSRPTRDLMGEADIPGVFTLSPQAKENFDGIDWGNPVSRDEAVRRAAEQGYKLRFSRGRPLRGPKKDWPVHECKDHEGIFTGPFGKARFAKHMKSAAHSR